MPAGRWSSYISPNSHDISPYLPYISAVSAHHVLLLLRAELLATRQVEGHLVRVRVRVRIRVRVRARVRIG